jgi:hypothetical protein
MKKKFLLLVVASTLITAGCGAGRYEPHRPAGLPKEAQYAGGVDGGEWAHCEPTADNRVLCTLFDAATGQRKYEKSLRLCPRMQRLRPRAGRDFRARYVDSEFAQFDAAMAFVDRPDRYFRRAGDSDDDVSLQMELSEKYYRDFGVTAECEPVSPRPPIAD